MNIIAIVLILLTIFVYVRFYTEPAKRIEIVQPRLAQLNQSHLQEKCPIVLSERIVNINQFIDTIFQYQYIKKKIDKRVSGSADSISCNKSRYLILYATQSCFVTIIHPSSIKSDKTFQDAISIKLLPHQLVIIPNRWWFKVDDVHARIYLDDIFSLLF